MNTYEILFYLGIGIGNLLISIEWAKKGFLETSIDGIRNKNAMLGWFIVVSTFIIGGITHRLTGFNPTSIYGIVLVSVGPLLIACVVRKIMPPGQQKFNAAKTRMNFWMQPNYYQPGKILKKGSELDGFLWAQQTIDMFLEAVIPHKTATSLIGRLNLAICYEELGMMYRLMNKWKEAEASYEKSLLLSRKLLEDYPNTTIVHICLSMALFRKAEMNHALSNFEEAVNGYQESIEADTSDELLTKDLLKKAQMRQN
ncbi:MAG: tetratricopeptide repeat protein [Patescibacteria group bacterium]